MSSSAILDSLSRPFEFHGDGAAPDLQEHSSDYLLSSEHLNANNAFAATAGFPDHEPMHNGTTLHLGTIWKILAERERSHNQTLSGYHKLNSSWELVIFQATVLCLILVVVLLWALCCKTRCVGDESLASEIVARHVAALARKISSSSTRDLPPSYSKVDLTVIGLSINDHFNPPPSYDRAIEAAANCTNAEYIAAAVHHVEPFRGRRPSRVSVVSTASSNITVLGGPTWHAPQRFQTQPSSQSLPLPPCLVAAGRRRSVLSEGNSSRRVSFVDELTGSQLNQSEQLGHGLRTRLAELEGNGRVNFPLSEQAMPCTTIVEMGSSEEDSDAENPSK